MLVLASIAAATAAPLDALDAGDRAWCAGDRALAADHWQQSLDDAPPAVEAMAAVRLLQTAGNLGMLRYGPRADRALAACPPSEPLCALARADYAAFLAILGLPSDLDDARRRTAQAADALPGRAQARRVLLGEASPDSLADHPDRGGLGDGLLAAGGWPRGPGTWYLGLGASGAPGLGVGGVVRFVHPDLSWDAWRLDTTATATTRGAAALQASLVSPGRVFSYSRLSLQRRVLDDYATETTLAARTADGVLAPGLRWGKQAAWTGVLLRWDAAEAAHGLQGGFSAARGAWTATATAEVSLVGPTHHRTTAEVVARRGHLAARLAAEEALGSAAPWWRQPVAGGGVHLRSAPAFRWQAPWLSAGAVEWRQPIHGPLGAVVFTEAAWVGALHTGVGAGLRLHLPPQPLNTVRLDLAWGGDGLVVTAGWGEAF